MSVKNVIILAQDRLFANEVLKVLANYHLNNLINKSGLVFIAVILTQPAYADPSSMISRQVSRTVSQEVNRNISEQVVKEAQKVEAVKEDKVIFAKAKIKQAQKLLKKLGFKPGVADGVMGRNTRKAITTFQKTHGLEGDGRLTESLLEKLG